MSFSKRNKRGAFYSAILILISVLFFSIIAAAENKPDDKTSPDYCLECHSGLTGKLKTTVDDWEKSVHSTAEIGCSRCHGGDPAINDKLKAKRTKNFIGRPGRAESIDFCGREGCHSSTISQLKRGPHYIAAAKKAYLNCVDCHGSHMVEKSSIQLIKVENCVQCHKADYSKQIIETVATIDKGIADTENLIAELKSKHADLSTIESRLSETRSMFHQLVHVFSNEDMNSTKKIIELDVENIASDSRLKLSQLKRLDILYLLMVTFTMAIVLGISAYTIIMYARRK
jgi:hypothetical protein